MKRIKNRKALSIPEILITVILGTVIVGSAVAMWHFGLQNWVIERIRSELRIHLETTMEKIKAEIRLSSSNGISLYKPPLVAYFTAISFPTAITDAQGFFSLDVSDNIIWDTSILYHVFENPASSGNFELRRTVFTSNAAVIADQAQREAQLTSVVTNGDGSSAVNSANASTEIMFTNLVDLKIIPQMLEFDGYSASIKQSDPVEFGSIRLTPGNHTLTFEVTGQNAASSGFNFGVDSLSISPSGCVREAEYYTAAGLAEQFQLGWNGNYYNEFSATAVGDSVDFVLYYDLWRESNFQDSIRDNIIITPDRLRAKLPTFAEVNEVAWQSDDETAASKTDYDFGGSAVSMYDITVRTLVSSANIYSEGDLVRVSFDAHSLNPLQITSVYLDERDANEDCVNPATSSSRIRLYFRTDASGIISDSGAYITTGGTVPTGTVAYTNWAVFEIDPAKYYFITYHVDDTGASKTYLSYWPCTTNVVNSYLRYGDFSSDADWPVSTDLTAAAIPAELPSSDPPGTASRHIYGVSSLEICTKSGEIISAIYDTQMGSPGYNQLAWSESDPSDDITMYARSSNDSQMTAAVWNAGSSANPHSVAALGSLRYVQFKSELEADPYWTCIDHGGVAVDDATYKAGAPLCPIGGCSQYLVPAIDCPWIDDVTIDWPGQTRMCSISGQFTQDSDYGIIKLTVDGDDLIKGFQISIVVYKNFRGNSYSSALTAEIAPRNTGF